jgi:ectoine hydroxylase-related dioxygenase (phytanoyl-CoA dioxygenase family)
LIEMEIFSRQFANAPASSIAAEIREHGIYACENAVRPDAVDRIMEEVGGLRFRVNENTLLPVISKHQTYQNNFLALSRTAFNLVCHPRITSICDELLGAEYRVVGKRIYETRFGNYMAFHSDVGSPSADSARVDGLGFIFYMCDVDDGPFEVVEGSHSRGESYLGSKENDAKLVKEGKVRAFPMPKGSYLIYNGRLLHRARAMAEQGNPRQSFHFQVNRGPKVSEPIYVNIGWLTDIDDKGKALLGYGVPPAAPRNWPETSPATILPSDPDVKDYLRTHFGHVLGRGKWRRGWRLSLRRPPSRSTSA